MEAKEALKLIGLEEFGVETKEGNSLINGTSVSSAVAVLNVEKAVQCLMLTMEFHALVAQAILAKVDPYDQFVQQCKPHPGKNLTHMRVKV